MGEKELAALLQSAVDEMHKKCDQAIDEAKKYGEPMAETKATIDSLNTTITEQKARLDEMDVKLQRQSIPGAGNQPPQSDEQKARTSGG